MSDEIKLLDVVALFEDVPGEGLTGARLIDSSARAYVERWLRPRSAVAV